MYINGDFMMDQTYVHGKYSRKIDVPVRVSTIGMGQTVWITVGNNDAETRFAFTEDEYDILIRFLLNFSDRIKMEQNKDSEIGPES